MVPYFKDSTMNLPRRHLVVGSVIYQEGQHVMHAQLGTLYSTVVARLYTMVVLSLAHKDSVVIRNLPEPC